MVLLDWPNRLIQSRHKFLCWAAHPTVHSGGVVLAGSANNKGTPSIDLVLLVFGSEKHISHKLNG